VSTPVTIVAPKPNAVEIASKAEATPATAAPQTKKPKEDQKDNSILMFAAAGLGLAVIAVGAIMFFRRK
jgi:hypothetical protein